MTIDRFFSIISMPGNFKNHLPFTTTKSAYYWTILILTILFLLNSHILILNGYLDPAEWRNVSVVNENLNGSLINKTKIELYQSNDLNCYNYPTGFALFPIWDRVHLFIYSFFPFLLMLIFNLLLIRKTLFHKTKNLDNNRAMRKKRKLTITLVLISFEFIILTLPANIAFGFFYPYFKTFNFGNSILMFLDFIKFFYHSSLFLNCFLTNQKFRQYSKSILLCFTNKNR
jgi:hypothetical protein